MAGVTVADRFVTADNDRVCVSYDDFASEKMAAKVTFKDGTAKTIALYTPSQTLHGTQRVELI